MTRKSPTYDVRNNFNNIGTYTGSFKSKLSENTFDLCGSQHNILLLNINSSNLNYRWQHIRCVYFKNSEPLNVKVMVIVRINLRINSFKLNF